MERRFEGGDEAPVPVAAGDHQACRDGEQDEEAQRIGVARGQTGRRPAQPKPADGGQQPAHMSLPQRLGPGIAAAGGHLVVALGQGTVGQCRVALDAARAVAPAGQAEPPEPHDQKPCRRQQDRGQSQHMEPAGHIGEYAEQGRSDEQADDAARRPQCRPQPLPGEGRARERDEPLDAVSLQAKPGGDPVQQARPHSTAVARRPNRRP